MVLVECHRDRPHDGIFRRDLSHQAIQQFAAELAARLAPRIGGRYIPKRTERDRIAERDAAVMAAFNGINHRQVMRDFRISRRLLYAILARCRRRAA
jgi:Mor family transcriptional regulator